MTRLQPHLDPVQRHGRILRSYTGMGGTLLSERPAPAKRRFSYEPSAPAMFAWYKPSTLGAVSSAVTSWADSSGNGRDLLLTDPGVPAPTVMEGINGLAAVNMGASSDLVATFDAVEVDSLTVLVVCGWGPFNGVDPASSYELWPIQVRGESSPSWMWLWLYAAHDTVTHTFNLTAENRVAPFVEVTDPVTVGSPLLLQATRELGVGTSLRYHADAEIVNTVAMEVCNVDTLHVSSWQGPLNEIRVYDSIPDLAAVRAELNTTYALGL